MMQGVPDMDSKASVWIGDVWCGSGTLGMILELVQWGIQCGTGNLVWIWGVRGGFGVCGVGLGQRRSLMQKPRCRCPRPLPPSSRVQVLRTWAAAFLKNPQGGPQAAPPAMHPSLQWILCPREQVSSWGLSSWGQPGAHEAAASCFL